MARFGDRAIENHRAPHQPHGTWWKCFGRLPSGDPVDARLRDSPIILATYLLDDDARSLEVIARAFDGKTEGLTRDDVLDNVTLFWLTNTGVSSARLYWEYLHSPYKLAFFSPKGVSVPVA